MSNYAKKLKDPRWQRRRLKILERDEWRCQQCFGDQDTLHVHHRWYSRGRDPWDAPDEALVTLCEICHETETASRAAAEGHLLEALKQHFFADHIETLAVAFENMRPGHIMDVVVHALELVISEPGEHARLIERCLSVTGPSDQPDQTD